MVVVGLEVNRYYTYHQERPRELKIVGVQTVNEHSQDDGNNQGRNEPDRANDMEGERAVERRFDGFRSHDDRCVDSLGLSVWRSDTKPRRMSEKGNGRPRGGWLVFIRLEPARARGRQYDVDRQKGRKVKEREKERGKQDHV